MRCHFLIDKHLPITKNTLGKVERLKSRKIIEQLFKGGKSIAAFPIRISFKYLDSGSAPEPVDLDASPAININSTGESILQAGFSASSRNFKKAVDRNRIKRLMRESYRKQKFALTDQLQKINKRLAIFIIYTGKELPEHQVVEEKMKQALKKLGDQLQ